MCGRHACPRGLLRGQCEFAQHPRVEGVARQGAFDGAVACGGEAQRGPSRQAPRVLEDCARFDRRPIGRHRGHCPQRKGRRRGGHQHHHFKRRPRHRCRNRECHGAWRGERCACPGTGHRGDSSLGRQEPRSIPHHWRGRDRQRGGRPGEIGRRGQPRSGVLRHDLPGPGLPSRLVQGLA